MKKYPLACTGAPAVEIPKLKLRKLAKSTLASGTLPFFLIYIHCYQ